MRITSTLIISSALLLSAGAAQSSPVNIVLNPGFEQGSLYWDYHEHFQFFASPLWAHSDPGVARLTFCDHPSCLDELQSGAFIGQLLATQPGDSYDLSFWVRSFSGESRLSVWWDGALLTSTGTPNGAMRQYAFSGLMASANATLLEVHGYNMGDKHLGFDDFRVMKMAELTQPGQPPGAVAQPVVEPGAWALVLAALCALGFARGRRT